MAYYLLSCAVSPRSKLMLRRAVLQDAAGVMQKALRMGENALDGAIDVERRPQKLMPIEERVGFFQRVARQKETVKKVFCLHSPVIPAAESARQAVVLTVLKRPVKRRIEIKAQKLFCLIFRKRIACKGLM